MKYFVVVGILILVLALLIIIYAAGCTREWLITEISRNERGFEVMKSKRLVVCSMVRDCEKSFDYSKQTVETLAPLFRELDVVILENDSSDNTRGVWLEYAKSHGIPNMKVTLIGCGINAAVCKYNMMKTNEHEITPGRIKKMVNLRNETIKYLRETYQETDKDTYIFMTDLDIQGILPPDGVANTFGYFEDHPEIDVIGCRGTQSFERYFDSYAFETDGPTITKWALAKRYIVSPLSVPMMRGLYKVQSTFSGGIFMPVRVIFQSEYVYRETDDGFSICEHVTFLEKFKEVYINTNLIYDIFKH